MKIKDLIAELQGYDGDLDVELEYGSYISPCNCDRYCYCSPSVSTDSVSSVAKREEYSRKLKCQAVTAVVLRG